MPKASRKDFLYVLTKTVEAHSIAHYSVFITLIVNKFFFTSNSNHLFFNPSIFLLVQIFKYVTENSLTLKPFL